MKILVSDKIIFDSAATVGRHQSVDSIEEHVATFWRRLLLEIEYYVHIRTADSYEAAVERLTQLRSLAITIGDSTTFNSVLAWFRERHQTKSMLISMLDRSVQPIKGNENAAWLC